MVTTRILVGLTVTTQKDFHLTKNKKTINNNMRIKFKFPGLIFYTDKVTKNNDYVVRGKAAACIVIIGTPYAKDLGLLAHEMSHVKEWWTHGLLIHNILYGAFRRYRLHSECEAYYKQWLLSGQFEVTKQDFAARIWLFYNLNYPREFVEKIFYSYF